MINEAQLLISNIRSARERNSDYTIPLDVSHIVLNALIAALEQQDKEPCGNCDDWFGYEYCADCGRKQEV